MNTKLQDELGMSLKGHLLTTRVIIVAFTGYALYRHYGSYISAKAPQDLPTESPPQLQGLLITGACLFAAGLFLYWLLGRKMVRPSPPASEDTTTSPREQVEEIAGIIGSRYFTRTIVVLISAHAALSVWLHCYIVSRDSLPLLLASLALLCIASLFPTKGRLLRLIETRAIASSLQDAIDGDTPKPL